MQNSLPIAIVIYKIYNLLYYGGSHRKTHRTPKIKGINKKKTAENSRKPRIISDFPKSNKFIRSIPNIARNGLTIIKFSILYQNSLIL